MQMNLNDIKFHCPPTKQLPGKGLFDPPIQVAWTPEEVFQPTRMPPAVHSRYAKCDFVLDVNIKYELSGCACATQPVCQIPLTVIPLIDMQAMGLTEPIDFDSYQLAHVNI